jgi:OmpA-OmpF porin, OOP family
MSPLNLKDILKGYDMRKVRSLVLAFALFSSVGVFAIAEDAEGCKDHPMFNRMTNFHIVSCESKEFDAFAFNIDTTTDETAKKETVEGKWYQLEYHVNEGTPEPSALQIFRNFENALKAINANIVGKVVVSGNSYSFITAKAKQGNNETWVRIEATGSDYSLVIVEKEAMVQEIQAKDMLTALNAEGHIALNILFDTGKAAIKAESQAIVDEIFNLLNSNPALKVSIEGHTDNVGAAADNKKLSDARAKAVLDALTTKGIAKERLSSVGWGQEKPVADNRTEEGRAKNRRVEIVKK